MAGVSSCQVLVLCGALQSWGRAPNLADAIAKCAGGRKGLRLLVYCAIPLPGRKWLSEHPDPESLGHDEVPEGYAAIWADRVDGSCCWAGASCAKLGELVT